MSPFSVHFGWTSRHHRAEVLSGSPSSQGADGGARTRDKRVPADLRADSLATVLLTPPERDRQTREKREGNAQADTTRMRATEGNALADTTRMRATEVSTNTRMKGKHDLKKDQTRVGKKEDRGKAIECNNVSEGMSQRERCPFDYKLVCP
ncbi:hypothetical protein PoB_005995700 [Plakobranchus ocellatus]|uniref:Uncharacterized protein n=1 Tax=Plakobranchus ocellatus TaxID=259542 RepID=A0AAV4CNK4_9GAST|nr:hypothetical protein PoB_005995700 [Plakobranchus ocellatus]